MKNLLFLVLLGVLGSCSFFQSMPPVRPLKDSLTQEYAAMRKQNISDVKYQLQFDLTDAKSFQGTSAIEFQLKEKMYLTLDFGGGEVQELIVNGKSARVTNYNGFFIEVPQEHQKVGANLVVVKYTHDYSRNGSGLYRYQDPVDNHVYLYSMFEPYHANEMFPSFDQPNLKATYRTRVLVPAGWQVITSVRESDKIAKGEVEEWLFPESAPFSTYTYSLHAGQYVVWEDRAETSKHKIPLRLFARKSLAQYVQTEDWFTWTKQGFRFFEKYYSYPYPYKKYDQLIVPDFNWGAMENVGAVTFNEDRFVSKGKKSKEQRVQLALTLFHEMAHMWFGNLVTMDWWNDLWLNESFATFSSYKGVAKATEFKDVWQRFYNSKQKAYQQDQSPVTHPVAQDCHHTDQALSSFDAITYRKGASVMKQLAYLLGDKTYRKGLKNYFKEFANKNTTLSDFMSAMEEVSRRDLKQWEQRWLKTAMLNTMEVYFQCKKGKITQFDIYQTGSKDYPTLRTHKTRLALFRKYRGAYKVHKTLAVEYSGEYTAVKKLIGTACPSIVYPNYGDHDYVSTQLDKKSLKAIESNLISIEDEFLRSLLWSDLWNMVLNHKMSMDRYLEIVEFNGLNEKNRDILGKVLDQVIQVLNQYYPSTGHPWVAKHNVWTQFFEQTAITKIYELTEEPEQQKLWFKKLVGFAKSPKTLVLLSRALRTNQAGLPLVFPVDQDLRWSILAVLSRHGVDGVSAWVKRETQRDSSKRGQLKALYAKVQAPDLKTKKSYFKELLAKKKTESFGVQRTIMAGLFPTSQKQLHRDFIEPFYSNLKASKRSSNFYFDLSFIDGLVPNFCDQKSSNQIARFIKEEDLSFPVRKRLKSVLHENQRCYNMRKVLKKSVHQGQPWS